MKAVKRTLGKDPLDGAMLYEGYRIRKQEKGENVTYLCGIHGEPTLKAMFDYIDNILLNKRRKEWQ